MKNIVVRRPGEVVVPVKDRASGATMSKTKSISSADYVGPYHPFPIDETQKFARNPFHVTKQDFIDAFFDDEQYENFLPEDERDEDNLGELSKGLEITLEEWHAAMLHGSLGNMLRLLQKNVSSDGEVGYLCGAEYHLLCSGTLSCCSASPSFMTTLSLTVVPQHLLF